MFSEQEGEFTVIGVIGNEGVGKSTLLSLLYQHQNFVSSSRYNIIEYGIFQSNIIHFFFLFLKEQTTTTPFPSQSEDNLLSGTHQTSGIDLCMNSNRTIFLDCQVIFINIFLDFQNIVFSNIANEQSFNFKSIIKKF